MNEKKTLNGINFITENEVLVKQKYLDIIPELKTVKTFEVQKIDEGVYALLVDGTNIDGYIDKKCNDILSILGIRKLDNFEKYLQELGIEETKNENGEYEMFVLEDGGKKRKLDKSSIEYFEVWKNISFLQGRDLVLHILEGDGKRTVMKLEDKMLAMMTENSEIRLIDLVIFLSKGNITQEQFKKYHKQLQLALLDQIGDNRFGLLPNNKEFDLNTKYGSFKINTAAVTKPELDYLIKSGLISEEIYKLGNDKIDDLNKLEKQKEEEKKKDLNKLEGEVKGEQNPKIKE